MNTAAREDAIYVGGPQDGIPFNSNQAALVEVEIDGLVHRYLRSTRARDSYVAYS